MARNYSSLLAIALAACSSQPHTATLAAGVDGGPDAAADWTLTQITPPHSPERLGADSAHVTSDGKVCTGWENGTVATVADVYTGAIEVQISHQGSEDCIYTDVDGDGVREVVSASEGQQNLVIDGGGWRLVLSHATVPSLPKQRMMQVDFADGVLYAGGKTGSTGIVGQLGYFTIAGNPRVAASWTWHQLVSVGWTMTLQARDLDGDGDRDVLYSDRADPGRDIGECEQVTGGQYSCRVLVAIGGDVAFTDAADIDGDGLIDLAGGNRSHLYTYTNDGNGRYVASADLKPAGTGDLHGVLFCDLAAGLELVTTYALTDVGDSWVGIVDPLTGAYTDVGGPATVIRKPDQPGCFEGSIVGAEGGRKPIQPTDIGVWRADPP